jgi:hypothetical protein
VDVLPFDAALQVPFVFQQSFQPQAESDVLAESDSIEFRRRDDDYGISIANTTFVPVSGGHESLLERLDRMERELEENLKEPLSESELNPPDELDEHEEALKNIAYTLDSLITDLLEAEAGEYAFPGFIQPKDTLSSNVKDEAVQPAKETEAGKEEHEPDNKKSRRMQEILMLVTLIAAIFMVGVSFGLWGSYFFGR